MRDHEIGGAFVHYTKRGFFDGPAVTEAKSENGNRGYTRERVTYTCSHHWDHLPMHDASWTHASWTQREEAGVRGGWRR